MALLPGIGRQDPHVGGRHGVGDVVRQAGDPGDLDAGSQLDLVPGHGRSGDDADETGVDTVLVQRLLELGACLLEDLAVLAGCLAELEEVDGREHVAVA